MFLRTNFWRNCEVAVIDDAGPWLRHKLRQDTIRLMRSSGDACGMWWH
jgi:hypothetical protein